MRVTFRQSFARVLKKVKDQAVLDRVRRAIEQVEGASTAQEVRDLKKMSGAGNFYRIRVGD
jgi:mRNA-degrading endonuclease RelE of RelBE toxin-antitoxin system